MQPIKRNLETRRGSAAGTGKVSTPSGPSSRAEPRQEGQVRVDTESGLFSRLQGQIAHSRELGVWDLRAIASQPMVLLEATRTKDSYLIMVMK